MKLLKKVSLLTASFLLVNTLSVMANTTPESTPEATSTQSTMNFITVSGDKLMDGDKEFRFISLNYPGAASDDAFSQEDAIRTIAAIGGKVTRSYTIGVLKPDGSNAGSAMVTAPGEFNSDAFLKLDNAIALCEKYGVRLIVPLVDHWQWVGGIESYAAFRNKPYDGDNLWNFYTDLQLREDFKKTIEYVLNRTNTVTGRLYKDEPAILAWETGNELGGYKQNLFPQEWTTDIAAFIKSQNPKQLVMDGRFEINAASVEEPNVDVLSNHYYTGSFLEKTKNDRAISKGKKPWILGEFGLYTKASDFETIFKEVVNNGTSGAMIWSLRPHRSTYGFKWHDEDPGNWASYHWPGFDAGDYYDEENIIRSVYRYAQLIDGKVPSAIPAPDPSPEFAPLLNPITSVGDINWRGVVGGAWYEIQRTETPEDESSWVTVGDNFQDGGRAGTPTFHDTKAITGKTYHYRVRGKNESGASAWSNVVKVENAKHVVTDELSLLMNPTQNRTVYAYEHSSNLTTTSDSWNEDGIGFKAVNPTANPGYLTYAVPVPMSSVRVTANGTAVPEIYASATNSNFVKIDAANITVTPSGNATVYSVDSMPENSRFVKVYVPTLNSAQIDKVEVEYNYTGTEDYKEVVPEAKNGFIVDNDFTTLIDSKSANVSLIASDKTEGAKALGRTNGEEGYVVYRTGGDINSYRFTTYADTAQSSEFEFYSSADGETYNIVTPDKSTSVTAGGWNKVLYTSFTVPVGTRYIKAVYPVTTDGNSPVISRVEVGFGTNMIPLTDKPPVNSLEDGEYYFGVDANIKAAYTKKADADDISISLDSTNKHKGNYGIKIDYSFSNAWYAALTKNLKGANLAQFDALHAWVKPDGSGNILRFQFKTGDDHFWEADVPMTDTTAKVIEIRYSDFKQPSWDTPTAKMDMTAVKEFSIFISSTSSAVKGNGSVYLDSINIANASKLDNLEGYGGYDALVKKAYARNTGGGTFDLSLDKTNKSEGSYGLKIDYNFNGPGYAGATIKPDFLNLNGYDGFTFWVKPDGNNNNLAIQFTSAGDIYWETNVDIIGTEPRLMYVPFSSFKHPSWYGGNANETPDMTKNIIGFSLYLGAGKATKGTSGAIYVDDINGAMFTETLNTATVAITNTDTEVTELPYTLTGTATNAKYVTIRVGAQVFYAPVGNDGKWAYNINKMVNGEREISANIELFNGTAIKTAARTVNVNVAGNDYSEGGDGGNEEPVPTGTNYAVNPGLEEVVDETAWPKLPVGWTHVDADGNAVTNGIVKLEGNTHSGSYKLVHWNDKPYNVTSSAVLTNLPDGIYEFRAWTKSKGQQAELIVKDYGGETKTTPIPQGEGSWALTKVSGIRITGGTATIGLHSNEPVGDNWAAIDDVEFVKTAEINYVNNPSFEADDKGDAATVWDITGWTKSGPDGWMMKAESKPDNAHSGNYNLAAWNGTAYEATLSQTVENLPNGVYELRAWAKSKDAAPGREYTRLVAKNYGGETVSVNIPGGEKPYQQIVIQNIQVTEGKLTVAFETKDAGNNWFAADDVELVRVGLLPGDIKSSDATLSGITVAGEALANFAPNTTEYTVVLPEGTTTVPAVEAAVTDSKASAVVTAATAIPAATVIVVTAEDGTQKTYRINFTVKQPDITIEKLTEVDHFNLGSDAKVRIKATNNTASNKDVTLVVALFDGNKFVAYSAAKQVIGQNGQVVLEAMLSLNYGQPTSGAYTIKALVWDSLDSGVAIADPIEIPVQ